MLKNKHCNFGILLLVTDILPVAGNWPWFFSDMILLITERRTISLLLSSVINLTSKNLPSQRNAGSPPFAVGSAGLKYGHSVSTLVHQETHGSTSTKRYCWAEVNTLRACCWFNLREWPPIHGARDSTDVACRTVALQADWIRFGEFDEPLSWDEWVVDFPCSSLGTGNLVEGKGTVEWGASVTEPCNSSSGHTCRGNTGWITIVHSQLR